MRPLAYVTTAVLAMASSGCGILLQSAFGWTSEDRVVQQRTHAIEIKSDQPGAKVTRVGPDGATQIGITPMTDEIRYQHETITETPATLGLLLGGVIEVAAAIGSFAAAGGSTDDCGDFSICETSSSVGLYVLGTTFAYLGVQDLVIALIYGLSGAQVKKNRAVDGPLLTYSAEVAGQTVEKKIKVPDSSLVKLVVSGSAVQPVVTQTAPPPAAPPAVTAPPPTKTNAGSGKWVVAVMDVEDVNADSKDRSVDRELVRDLGDQLRIFIAQTGMRTIDRGAQERAFKEQIAEAKSNSYKACYDDSCQIELGKALAASHILRSRITRFGSKCVLNAELIDLRAEVTVKAASARGDCRAEGFLNMSEEVAQNIVN